MAACSSAKTATAPSGQLAPAGRITRLLSTWSKENVASERAGRARSPLRAVARRRGQLPNETAGRGLPALPTRRRPVIRTINPHPLLCSLAQSFADRIHEDVAGFLFQFMMTAQPVIKEIALPIHATFSSDELLPVRDGDLHSRFA